MADRVFNFSAGPAALPLPVLEEVQRDLLCYPGAGASVMEISHRSGPFQKIIGEAESDLRALVGLSDEYAVLFLQGGGRLQFSMVPMNLIDASHPTGHYIVTGSWGKNAHKEASKNCSVAKVWDGAEGGYTKLPQAGDFTVPADSAFAHITSNETIEGVQFHQEPDVGDVPLVADLSSDFLSRPIDAARYGLIYACAQKNAGPAGVTVVIMRRDLLDRCDDSLPGYLNYSIHDAQGSLWNTAPTFAIYVTGLVFRWVRNEFGSLDAVAAHNQLKAKILYDVLDASGGFYAGHAQPECRSQMNVTFRLPSSELTEKFCAEAQESGLHSLKGHRSVGGVRASIYNAMPTEGVERLRDFMSKFQHQNA